MQMLPIALFLLVKISTLQMFWEYICAFKTLYSLHLRSPEVHCLIPGDIKTLSEEEDLSNG